MPTVSRPAALVLAAASAVSGRAGLAAPDPAAREARAVPVVFAFPPSADAPQLWRGLAEGALQEATRLLQPHLDVRFEPVGVTDWDPSRGLFEDWLDTLRAQVPRAGRIVVGIAPVPGEAPRGRAAWREGLIVIAAPPASRLRLARLLAHELAHVFGAVHLPGELGLMAESNPGPTLDPLNARFVGLQRNRSFESRSFPLPPDAVGPALAAYQETAARSPEAALHAASLALEAGDPAAALEGAEALLKRDPGDVEAQNVRGIALRRLGRPAEAVAAYEAALRRRPRYAALHYNLALALDRLGESDRAAGSYEQAARLDPGHVLALSNLARLRARRGEAALALAAARRALSLDPDFAEARINLAMAHLAAGDPSSGETEARRAVTERPRSAEAHEALGAALLALGRPQDAVSSFGRALELQPDEERLRGHLAVALRAVARQRRDRHDTAGAADALRQATAAAPGDAEAWSERADLAFERGQRGEAREAYLRLLELRSSDATAHNNLAVVLFREGDLAGARAHVDAARQLGLAVHPDFLRALEAAERE
jgi:tetratricopeptide (TPR) repeat protein